MDGGGLNSTNLTTITVSATVNFIGGSSNKLPDGFAAVTGDVPLGDWVSLSSNNHPLNSLKMTFGVPFDLKKEDACVILTVPVTFLSLSKRSSVCIPTFLNKTITHVGELNVVSSIDSNYTCKLGYLTNLNFHSDEDFYLSKMESCCFYFNLFFLVSWEELYVCGNNG
ncbi:hypothetical protein Phum_PHUM607630 [Pediculus humanus corporis]|uniref:Uncharacterized protein n=1 Tax=Pediculus humanus subsp. corporis TaxID=121224 RepID=E0W3N3_PEDHC|nr:uncharacterized protein Phum_PHUM607630 [Pediculus humanus corporis]EEB20239.1 hypothetical protein Phum_PHUM607630 [Pediculus humanus corporis]